MHCEPLLAPPTMSNLPLIKTDDYPLPPTVSSSPHNKNLIHKPSSEGYMGLKGHAAIVGAAQY